MHKTRYNSLYLALEVAPRGPLLIKSGEFSATPSLPDMQFVRTYQASVGETLYIPGSSLKGVVRSFVEKALRTLDDRGTWRWACPTFESKGKDQEQNCPQHLKSIEDREERTLPSWEIYRLSCGTCRLFGHTRLRGRVAFTDFFPNDAVKTEIRYGVAISRLSHAVAQGPFEAEIAVAGTFKGHLVLENYELWQLGLLAMALDAMNQGLFKIGFGKNRGFGEVQVTVTQIQVEEIMPVSSQEALRGLSAFVDQREQEKYGLAVPNVLAGLCTPVQTENLGFYLRRTYDGAGWQVMSRKAIEVL